MRNKIIKDTFFLNTASLLKQGLAVLQSLIVMRFLDPGAYGVWLSLNIVLTYAGYINLGLEYGMGNLVPYYQGLDNTKRILQIQDTVYVAWTALASLCVVGIGVYMMLIPLESSLLKLGLIVISIMVLFEQQILFRARWTANALKDFKLYSLLSVFRGLVSFIVIVPMAFFWKVEGLIFGTLIVSGVHMIAWIIKASYSFQGQISMDALWETLSIGFPIFIIVLGGSLIETVDRVLILKWLGPVQLGYYSLTSFGGNSLYGLLAQAGSAMGPHIIEDMGRSNNSPEALEKYLVGPTILFSGLITIMIMGLIFVMPLLVQWVVPKYLPGLVAFYLFVPGFFFLSIILTANGILYIYLITRRTQRIAVYIQFATISIEVLAGILFIRLGWGIAGVALASTLAYAFYGLMILNLAAKYVLPDMQIRRFFIFRVMFPFVCALLATLLTFQVANWLFPVASLIKTIFQLVLYGLTALSILFWLEKNVGILVYIRPWINWLFPVSQ